MIISKAQVQNILKTYAKELRSGNVEKGKQVQGKLGKDELSISGDSKLKQRVMQAAIKSEDIRSSLVKELAEKISTGSYEVSNNDVAEKMISRAIIDKII